MKKIMISCIIVMIFIINLNQIVYASDSWVSDAFSDAKNFLEGETTTEVFGFENDLLAFFTNSIQGINYVLLVLLSGLSIISLSLIGVRYLLSGASPQQKETAKKSLHTVFIGMAYGFGAFIIWNIAMQIVRIIINTFAS